MERGSSSAAVGSVASLNGMERTNNFLHFLDSQVFLECVRACCRLNLNKL